jgi:hypothetical protein
MKPPLSFAKWFLILDLGIWLSFFAIPAANALFNLELAARGAKAVHLAGGSFSADIPRSRFIPFALEAASFQNRHTIMALNTPGMFGEILVSLPTTWPMSFRPHGMMFDEWRCLSLPFFCAPFWWFAGRGVDGLVGLRKPHWSVAVLGAALSVFFLVLFLGLQFMMSADERAETVWPLWGLILWGLLFAIQPLAWWLRRRSARLAAAI